MSGVLDENVVILKFDNSDFEKNTEQSMKTLERLKSSFKESDSAEAFTKIGKAADSVNLDRLADGVDHLQRRFSLFGTIGTQAINNLTNYAMSSTKRILTAVPNQIIQGGWKRAMNIEQAKFQIEGLKLAWDETSEAFKKGSSTIKENVLDAVNGTAYGLDEAARVAAQFAASGMQAGEEMTNALKGIAGVAAMSGSSFSDIGRIFTQVSGQGRLMGDQLLQLSARGMNAAATLAQALGKTESEVREMVSKGQIDFKTFASAMNEAFGEHAKKANDTYTGSLSNMKAALSRIGADVESKKLENMRHIFNALTPVIDQVHVLLGGVINRINTMSTAVTNFAVKGLNSIEFALKPSVDAIKGEVTQLSYLDRIYEQAFIKLTKKQKKATKGMEATAEEAKAAWDIINGKYSPEKKERKAQLEEIGLEYKRVQRYVNSLVKAGLDEEKSHIKVAGAAKKTKKELKETGEETRKLGKSSYELKPIVAVVGTVANAISAAKMGFSGVKNLVISTAKAVRSGLEPIFGKTANTILKFSQRLFDSAKNFKNFAKQVTMDEVGKGFEKLSPRLQKMVMEFRSRLSTLESTVKSKTTGLVTFVGQLRDRLSKLDSIDKLAAALKRLGGVVKNLAFQNLEKITPFIDKFKTMAKGVVSVDNIANKIDGLANKINKFVDGMKTGVDPLNKFLTFFTNFEGKLSGLNIAKFGGDLFSKNMRKNAFANLQGIAKNVQKADVPGAFNQIAAGINKVTSSVIAAQRKIDIKNGVKGIIDWLAGLDYNKLSTIGLKISGMVGIFYSIKKLGDLTNATIGMLGSISGFFRSLSGIAGQVKTNLKIEAFRTIAMSIALMAGSVAILAMIPKDRLAIAAGTVTALMGLMIGVVALTNSGKFDPNKMRTLGVAFAGMGAAMLALAVSCEKLAKLSVGEIAKAGFTITAFIGMFVGTSKFAAEIQKSGKSFALMAAAIDMLVFAVTSLAALKYTVILEGGSAIMLLMSELAIASRIAKNSKPGGFAAMALAIDLLIPAIVGLAMIPYGMIIKSGITMMALMRSLAVSARIASSSKSNMMTMVSMTTMIAAAAGALVVLSFIDPDKLLVSATALVTVVTTVAMATEIANRGKKGALAIAGVVAILTGAIIALIKMDVNKSVTVAAGLGILAASLAKSLELFSTIPITGVLKGLAGLAIAVTGIISLMALLGGLNKLTNGIAVKGIQSFGDILEAIGEAFGRFTGGFISGMSSGLPAAAQNLSMFMANIQPFLALAKDIKGGSLDGIKNLSKTLTNLTSIDFSSLHGEGKLESFGVDLQALAAQFKVFAAALGEIPDSDVSKTNKVTKIMESFSNIAKSLPEQGGLAQKIEGTKDLSKFALQIGSAMLTMSNSMTLIGQIPIPEGSDKKVSMIAKAIGSMAKVAKAIPESEGAIQMLAGNTTINEFATMLGSAVEPLGTFFASVNSGVLDLSEDSIAKVETVCDVIGKMVEAGSKIPPSAGLAQFGKGNTTINEFAVMMNKMCEPLSSFLAKIGMFTDAQMAAAEKIPGIAKAIAWMAWAANKIPESGGIKQAIKGMPNLSKFSTQLSEFAPNFATFMTNLKGVTIKNGDVKNIQNIAKGVSAIAKMANSLDNSGGLSGKIFGDQDLGAFSDGLSSLAEGVNSFSSKTSGVDPERIASIAKGLWKAMNNFKTLGEVPTGAGLATLGKNVKKFSDSMAGVVTKGMSSKAEAVGEAVTNLIKSANKAAKNANMSQFSKTGEKAGKQFVNGIKKEYTSAIKAGKNLGDKTESGMKIGGAGAYKIGENIGKGFINGIESKKKAAYDAGYALGKAAINGKKDGSDSHSPSRAAMRVGRDIGEGLVIGLNSYLKKAYRAGYSVGSKALQGQMDGIDHAINDISHPVITPVLDASNIEKGMAGFNNRYSIGKAMNINPTASNDTDKLLKGIAKINSKNQSRPSVNHITINVDGAENPEEFAMRLTNRLNLEMRTG